MADKFTLEIPMSVLPDEVYLDFISEFLGKVEIQSAGPGKVSVWSESQESGKPVELKSIADENIEFYNKMAKDGSISMDERRDALELHAAVFDGLAKLYRDSI